MNILASLKNNAIISLSIYDKIIAKELIGVQMFPDSKCATPLMIGLKFVYEEPIGVGNENIPEITIKVVSKKYIDAETLHVITSKETIVDDTIVCASEMINDELVKFMNKNCIIKKIDYIKNRDIIDTIFEFKYSYFKDTKRCQSGLWLVCSESTVEKISKNKSFFKNLTYRDSMSYSFVGILGRNIKVYRYNSISDNRIFAGFYGGCTIEYDVVMAIRSLYEFNSYDELFGALTYKNNYGFYLFNKGHKPFLRIDLQK